MNMDEAKVVWVGGEKSHRSDNIFITWVFFNVTKMYHHTMIMIVIINGNNDDDIDNGNDNNNDNNNDKI